MAPRPVWGQGGLWATWLLRGRAPAPRGSPLHGSTARFQGDAPGASGVWLWPGTLTACFLSPAALRPVHRSPVGIASPRDLGGQAGSTAPPGVDAQR